MTHAEQDRHRAGYRWVAFCSLLFFAVVGALLSGAISDRLGRKNIMGLADARRSVVFALLLFWRSACHVTGVLNTFPWHMAMVARLIPYSPGALMRRAIPERDFSRAS